MSVSERSDGWVADQLARLTDEYGSASVHQLGWSVSGDRYDWVSAVGTDERATAGVRVTNDADELLLVRERDEWVCPRGPVKPGESLEAGAVRNVREETGIDCRIDGVERVTIAGVTDETDRDRRPIYWLVVRFLGSCDANQRVECSAGPVRWRRARPTDRLDPGVLAI